MAIAKEYGKARSEKSLGWAIDKVKAPEPLTPLVATIASQHCNLSEPRRRADCPERTQRDRSRDARGGISLDRGSDLRRKPGSIGRFSTRTQSANVDPGKECSEIGKQRDAFLKKYNDARGVLEKATSELEDARRAHETAEREKTDCDNRILFLTRELQEGEQKQTQVRSEQTTLARQIQAADERIAKLEDELAAEQATLEANQGEQKVLQAARDDGAKREDEATEQLNELRLTVATERQRHEHLIAQRQPMSAREAELAEVIATRRAEITGFEKAAHDAGRGITNRRIHHRETNRATRGS